MDYQEPPPAYYCFEIDPNDNSDDGDFSTPLKKSYCIGAHSAISNGNCCVLCDDIDDDNECLWPGPDYVTPSQ
jgi:hypothetical protein